VKEAGWTAKGRQHVLGESLASLLQRNGFLRADLLAAEARDTGIGIHLGDVVIDGKRGYGTLIDAGAAACTEVGIGARSHYRSAVDILLYDRVLKNSFAGEGRKLEVGQPPQLPYDIDGAEIVIP